MTPTDAPLSGDTAVATLLADPATTRWPAAVIDLLTHAAPADLPSGAFATGHDDVHDALWSLTETAAARLDAAAPDAGALLTAAALQTACRLLLARGDATGPDWQARRDRLEALTQAGPARVTLVHGGPIVAQAAAVVDHLGCSVALGSPAALCRCGRSTVKPSCDATCLRDGFDDAKDPKRVSDHRDTYVGQQVTVFDNRGICQHSGLCTDRLAGVFHAGDGPFVTPSGGRMDEIIRAVRDCPSGALSYAIDGHEARDQVDWGGARTPTIEITKDGPYRLGGGIAVDGADGSPSPRAEGASLEHCALCRCGQSQNKPFCSGMHWYVQFRDPVPEDGRIPSIFEWAGGLPALTRMTRIFYERHVPADPLIGPLFATMSADHPQRVAAWLSEVFGGPALYSDAYGGYGRMLSQHRGKGLTEQQRARWVELLTRAARDAGLPNDPEFRSAFGAYIEWGSRLAHENSQADSTPPEHMPMPRWDWNTSAGPPGSRISALGSATATVQDEPVQLPADGEAVRYDPHIRSMFRDRDRRSMLFAFDLWKRDDVVQHAGAILTRLQAGTMPCDGPWPADHVTVFARWVSEGAT